MTTQSQPLTLKLSTGQEVSIADAKSVLRHTENGKQQSCAIVRGTDGVAVYNAEGDVQINGAPSSAHWLKAGDQLEFGDVTASVEQLGMVEQAIESLLKETQSPAVPPTQIPSRATAPTIAFDPASFRPETAAAEMYASEQANTKAIDLLQSTVSHDAPTPAVDLSIPVAPTEAPITTAGIASAAVPTKPAAADSNEQVDFTLPASLTHANREVVEPASVPPSTGFAAELLASIQADDDSIQTDNNSILSNGNETVGTPTSETTHSTLAADGPSFSTSANDSVPISNLIPELPSSSSWASDQAEQQRAESELPQTQASELVETSTIDSTERQAQSSSVSALLERMKSEGQWGGLSEEAAEEAAAPASGGVQETPVLDEADEDVQSYMSQLLSRMRDPNDERPAQPVASAVATPKPAEPKPAAVEIPKPVGLLKPEEYIPKNKARRLDSLQDMRALANNQTRTAIDRSQAKRREASIGTLNIAIAVASFMVAAIIFSLNVFGYLSFPLALIAAAVVATICGAFFCCKNFFSELLGTNKKDAPAAPQRSVETH